jgi:hypothetical protein
MEKTMKKLLATTAVAMIAFTGAASAQSVLERVLGQIDNSTNLASVNGTFANIAENIGGAGEVTVFTDVNTNDLLSQAEYDAGLADAIAAEIQTDLATLGVASYRETAPEASDFDLTTTAGQSAYNTEVGLFQAYENAIAAAESNATNGYVGDYTQDTVAVAGLSGINGSISNVVDGIDSATQEAVAGIDVSAIEWDMPTLDFGDMATTALGAVNTGDITLGVNSSVDEAKTSSTQAVSSVMSQLGGSADTGAIVLNIASNMTGINGSISNAMVEVNGTIGNLSTTALGAVNTGTIVSGVDSAVQGIVGMSGANIASN